VSRQIAAACLALALCLGGVAQGADSSKEDMFWNSVKQSDAIEEYRVYVEQYPNGKHIGEAWRRIGQLEAEEKLALAARREAEARRQAQEEAARREGERLQAEADALRPGHVGQLEAQEQAQPLAGTAKKAKKVKKARLATADAKADALHLGNVVKDCTECPEMVVVPAGSFEIGSNDGDSDEKPVHTVRIARPFALGKTEVTQGQWRAVMGYNPSRFTSCGDDCPVENVSWNDIQDFIRKLNARTGKQFRLPSEAEWEYAARAGTTTKYAWGNEIGRGNANCDGCGSQWDNKTTAPVASFRPSAFGLYDMHGNVWEWVEDCKNDGYSGAPSDGSVWTRGNCSVRVLRGGSWFNVPRLLRSAGRNGNSTGFRGAGSGFRLARTRF